jgi:phage tail-like protein
MAVGTRKDPYLNFTFLVEIEGMVVGGFTEVSGLHVEVEVKDYREGGLNDYIHKLPGPTRYPSNLILKRGLTDAETLLKWHREVNQGIINRKNGSIVLLDSSGEETWRWNFVQAYPVKWSGPDLRAGTAEVAVETLELAHHGLIKSP